MITFAELCDVFWSEHDPCRASWSSQYESILFYADEQQRETAEQSAARVAEKLGKPVRTSLRALERFYRAEDYHQKYALRRNRELTQALMAIYPGEVAFAESTAAAKVNAHLDGHLTLEALRRELAALGLRAVGERRLEGVERAPHAQPPEPPRNMKNTAPQMHSPAHR